MPDTRSAMNRIRQVDLFRATSPASRSIADSTHSISTIGFIIVRLKLETGVRGEAYLLSFDYSPNAIAGALRDAASHAIGRDVSRIGEFVRVLDIEQEYFGRHGINRWARAAFEIAMWDAWARTIGQPVHRLFGIHRENVPLYGSGGWLSYSIDELLDEVTRYVKRGFRAVKVKVGSPDLQTDVERLRRVREAVGPHVNVMMDANQGMTVASALALVSALHDTQITWFEEPIPNTDFAGYEQLRRQARVSLAMGEREFDTVALRELIARNAIDLWQPDILRLGGVDAWRASAAVAQAHHLPVLPHYYKEYDVPLLMTIPNALAAEYFEWVDGLIDQPIRMRDGLAYPNDGPGWGFTFDDRHLTHFATIN